jgi:hypothetical protein
MDDTKELIERIEQLLTQVEALQHSVRQMNGELLVHSAALRDKLAELQEFGQATLPELELPPEEVSTGTGSRVDLVLEAAVKPRTRDRRVAPRRSGNLVPVLLSDAQALAEPFEGWVLDRSPGGLGLLVDEAVIVGSILSVRPAKSPPRFRWLQVEVKSCRPHQNSWSLGCQFLQRISWNDLRLFG